MTTRSETERRLVPAGLLDRLPRSGIREIAEFAGDRAGLVHLEYGEPSLPTPEPIRRKVAQAVLERRMVYTPVRGPERLRELIAAKVREVNGYPASADEVFVTNGGTGGLFLALAAVLEPGASVLLPDPGWPNPVGMAHVLGARPHFYRLDPENGFLPDPGDWRVPADCRAVVVNSPANPTGSVFPEEVAAAIADLARRRGLWVISDEVYDQIYFDRRPTAMARLYPEGTISVYSFSKTYAMTGWRLGYLVGPAALLERLEKVAESVASSTSMPAQIAAEAALVEASGEVPAMVAAYRSRRDLAVRRAKELGLYRYTPEGAFYLMVDVSRAGASEEVARRLIEEKSVVATPGSAFGPSAAGYLRISLAAAEEDVECGLVAIAELLSEGER